MAAEKRVTFNEHGEPEVIITITGWHDAFRLSWAMAHLQCDFADLARMLFAHTAPRAPEPRCVPVPVPVGRFYHCIACAVYGRGEMCWCCGSTSVDFGGRGSAT